jgi:hypothetical protein
MYITTSDREVKLVSIDNYPFNRETYCCRLFEEEKVKNKIIFDFLIQVYFDGDFKPCCRFKLSTREFQHLPDSWMIKKVFQCLTTEKSDQ